MFEAEYQGITTEARKSPTLTQFSFGLCKCDGSGSKLLVGHSGLWSTVCPLEPS